MDMEELEPGTSKSLPFGREDISGFSIDALEERIEALQMEIARCRSLISSKQESRIGAEALFKK